MNELRARVLERQFSAKSFKKTYGERSPEHQTLEKLLSSDAAEQGKLGAGTLDRIEACLDLNPLFYETYHALRRAMIGDVLDASAGSFVGDYNFFRSTGDGTLASGGMRLFGQHGLNRFWHYPDFDDLTKLREAENCEAEDAANLVKKLQNWKRARYLVAPPRHQGYYFVQQGKIVLVGLDSTYFRTIMGPVVSQALLKTDALKVVVLGIHSNGGIFAAKSIMYHHTNTKFGKKLEAKAASRELGVEYLPSSMLMFGT